MKLIECPCYACYSTESTFYATENGINLEKCSTCGLLYVNPRPSDADLVEAHEYGVHKGDLEIDTTGSFNETKVQLYLEKIKTLFDEAFLSEHKSVLDIGCGHGEFLAALKFASDGHLQLRGLEPNIRKQPSAKTRGLDVSHFDINSHDEKYDLICLLNVFSHLPDPTSFILVIKRLLNDGGVLLLETGDTADLPSEQHHRPFYLPDHLCFASEKIICELLLKCGFEVVLIKKFRSFQTVFNRGAWLKETLKIFWPGKKSRLMSMVQKLRHERGYLRDMYVVARLPDGN